MSTRRNQRARARLSTHAAARNARALGRRAGTQQRATRRVRGGRCAFGVARPWRLGDRRALGATARAAALPLALTSFVGREAELDEIAALVREHRLVTLTGAGGIGKTQTALQVATALSEAGDIAVCFVGLAPIGNPALVVAAIASALGVQEVPNRPLLETLLAYLKNKTLLLILDNCEHVIAEAATIADSLLAGCPASSDPRDQPRTARAAGEYCYRLPSLAFHRRKQLIGCGSRRHCVRSDRPLYRSCPRRRPSLRAYRRERADRCRDLPASRWHSARDRTGRRSREPCYR